MARKPAAEPGTGDATFAELWDALEPGTRASKGVYSIYKTTDGSMHLAFRKEDDQEDSHVELPAAMLTMAFAAMAGKLSLTQLAKVAMARFT